MENEILCIIALKNLFNSFKVLHIHHLGDAHQSEKSSSFFAFFGSKIISFFFFAGTCTRENILTECCERERFSPDKNSTAFKLGKLKAFFVNYLNYFIFTLLLSHFIAFVLNDDDYAINYVALILSHTNSMNEWMLMLIWINRIKLKFQLWMSLSLGSVKSW